MKDLQFAIQMELDGMEYYKQQMEKNKDNALNKVFWRLMKDEEYHAKLLRDVFENTVYELTETESVAESENVFANLGDFKDEIMAVPHQIDVYREALKREKESVELYTEMLGAAFEDKEKILFEFLVGEEKKHYKVINNLIGELMKPEEWVEDAEFGIREEY